jgi:hypothetical protein
MRFGDKSRGGHCFKCNSQAIAARNNTRYLFGIWGLPFG